MLSYTSTSSKEITEAQLDVIHALYSENDLEYFIDLEIDRLNFTTCDADEFQLQVTGHWRGSIIVSFDHYDDSTWAIEYTHI